MQSPERTTVLILANPRSGRGPSRNQVDELVRSLPNHGMDSVVCWHPEELPGAAQKFAARLRCVVAAGGDGTLGEVLNRLPGCPVALLPLGHENLAARHFRYPRSGTKLAAIIARDHRTLCDLAVAGGRVFSLMAGAGFDAEVVHRLHQARTGHVSQLLYARRIWDALRGYAFPTVDVQIGETGERLRGAFVGVYNMREYGMRLPMAPGANPSDGLLDVWVFEKPGVHHLLNYVATVVRGRQARRKDIHHRRTRSLTLAAADRVPLQLDGDPFGHLPVAIECRPAAATFVTPTP